MTLKTQLTLLGQLTDQKASDILPISQTSLLSPCYCLTVRFKYYIVCTLSELATLGTGLMYLYL